MHIVCFQRYSTHIPHDGECRELDGYVEYANRCPKYFDGYAAVVVDEDGWHYAYPIGLGDEAECRKLAIDCAEWDRLTRLAKG